MQKQRQWLNDTVSRATAAVTLVASGSVLLGRPGATNAASDSPPFSGICSGDDWDCYRPAQQNLLSMLARKSGCVIVLTGDYHMADIKRIIPGENAPYQDVYSPPVRTASCAAPRLRFACCAVCGCIMRGRPQVFGWGGPHRAPNMLLMETCFARMPHGQLRECRPMFVWAGRASG